MKKMDTRGQSFLALGLAFFLAGIPGANAQSSSLRSPNVSANALFLGRNSNFAKGEQSTTRNGLDVQEAELAFYADVDPYSRLNMILSLHPEYTLNSSTNKVDQAWKLEPEEIYADSNHVSSTTLRVGKFKAAFGKHNLMHSHAYPLVDAPLANESLLGSEGLNDVGVSAAYLVPLPWFFEATGQYLRGKWENSEFNSPTSNDGVVVGHIKNLFDLSEETTMEFGSSIAHGNNAVNGITNIFGGDLTFKWRPAVGGKYRSLILASEVIHRKLQQQGDRTEIGTGYDVWAQYQFAERWALVGRYDYLTAAGGNSELNSNALTNGTSYRYTGGLGFNLSEFSALKFNFSYLSSPPQSDGQYIDRKYYLQANFTIGAHPAHAY